MNIKPKFLRQLALVNMPEDAVWEEYEEVIVKQQVMPQRKLVDDLNDKEKEKYAPQIVAAKKMVEGTEDKPYIVVPLVMSSITNSLKAGCGKFIYRQLKKSVKRGELEKLKNLLLPKKDI